MDGLKAFSDHLVDAIARELGQDFGLRKVKASELLKEIQIKKIENELVKLVKDGSIKKLKINHKTTPEKWVKNKVQYFLESDPRLNGGKEKLTPSEFTYKLLKGMLEDEGLYDSARPMRNYFAGGTHHPFNNPENLNKEQMRMLARMKEAVAIFQEAVANDEIVIQSKNGINPKTLIMDRLNKDSRLNGGKKYRATSESLLDKDPILKRARYILAQKERKLLKLQNRKSKDTKKTTDAIKETEKSISGWLEFIGEREAKLDGNFKESKALIEALSDEEIHSHIEKLVYWYFKNGEEKAGIEQELFLEKILLRSFEIINRHKGQKKARKSKRMAA